MSKKIINRFNKAFPALVELGADIELTEYVEPMIKKIIDVKHPFLFDNRLIPSEFEGLSVRGITMGKFPKEFVEPKKGVLSRTIAFSFSLK